MTTTEYLNINLNRTDVPGPIMNMVKYSNVDYWYGPYNSKEDAKNVIPRGLRGLGLTVGVIENGSIIEYQWKQGIEDEDLELKVEKINLTLAAIGDTIISKEEGEAIIVNFSIGGRASLSKGLLYQVIGNSEVFIGEFTNIGKGNNAYLITNITTSGVYTYRIKVLDSSGAYATLENGTEYLEYEIRYGRISAVYNFSKLNTITIKNVLTVAGLYFTCNISVRDDSFRILGMYLSDNASIRIQLTPCDSLGNPSLTHLGNNYYFLPNTAGLLDLNGKACYLILEYTESGARTQLVTSLFTLLDTDSLEFVPEGSTATYYVGLPAYYAFKLLTGVENISVTLSKHPDSDFNFETVTVAAYKRFSLKIIPNTVKGNASLKLNYSFYYNNEEKTGTITQQIGEIQDLPEQHYYEPANNSTTTKYNIVYSDAGDYNVIDDGQYYKIINTPITREFYSCAFILDLYCRINTLNDKSIKYLTIKYGGEEIGYITEDEIKCKGISTDTPLDEWTLIGLGFNLQESIERNNIQLSVSYFAIYINGMVVKNILIDNADVFGIVYNPTSVLQITLGNGIQIQKCFVYYKNNGSDRVLPNTEVGNSIIYNNYLSHNVNFSEPADLPELKLMKITDSAENQHYFELINAYKTTNDEDLIVHTTKFGEIGSTKATTMLDYDAQYSTSTIETNATLFRQSVDIKKPAQKEYAVLCRGQYLVDGVDILDEGVIIEVHTQGTSTLVYSVPNFKFTFWWSNPDTHEWEHYYPNFIVKGLHGDEIDYYHEYIYTAKADYMDSSHLNNTPTCNYYNNLIQKLISNNEIVGSPSAQTGGIDAIMGFPIIMEISDTAEGFGSYFTNIGSFMLNVDKTGQSLGFEVNLDGENTLSCLSFEGTSNDNEHGAAGRFIIPDTITLNYGDNSSLTILELKDYSTYENMEDEITADYNTAKSSIKNLTIADALMTLPYVQWCNFLSQGLEYRYPDADIYKEKSGKVNKILALDHFKKIYRMWNWVNKSDSNPNYVEEFTDYFDLHYCMLYFIQLMIFGQTDNLGKNAMFDTWDGIHWYPRPYDLDSQTGLDNNGNDNIAPFVEIKPEFSLNYKPNYTLEELEANYLTENSTIMYGTLLLDRYHYSSNNSKLWINFYKNFKSNIEGFYNQLRKAEDGNNNLIYNYSPDSIIELCLNLLINVLGIKQYNLDFINKYLANKDQALAYGNRWYKFKKWLKQRFAFCDSYFGASDSATYSITSAFTFNIKVSSPQYITCGYQDNSVVKFVLDLTTFQAGSGAATKTTLRVNQNSVLETGLFKYVSGRDLGPNDFSGLITLDVSGNNKISGITGLVGSVLPNLRDLNISNSTISSVTIPASLKKFTANGVTLNSITFEPNCLIEEISLLNATLTGEIAFSGLPNLKKLDLTNCRVRSNITLENLENILNFTIEGASFDGDVIISDHVNIHTFDFSGLALHNITFNGSDLDINTLNFRKTTFGLSSINLDAVRSNVQNIYFNDCTNLSFIEITESFENLQVFSITNSSVTSIGTNNTKFDASVFPNISSLKRATFNSEGVVSSTPTFSFQNTRVALIVNLTWNGSGENLFSGCRQLTSFTNSTLNVTNNLNYTFYLCSALTNLPTMNIDNSDANTRVVTANYTFAMCDGLGYTNISSVIRACKKVTTFSSTCRCVKFPDGTTIDLSYLFGLNSVVTSLTHMFNPNVYGESNLSSKTNKLVITGQIPTTVTTIQRMFSSVSTISVPYNIISSSSVLTDILDLFYGSTITFTAPSGVSLPRYTTTIDGQGDRQITLTNVVTKEFFPSSITNATGVFYNTNIIIKDTDVFSTLTNLTSCQSCFGHSSPFKFRIGYPNINNSSQTIYEDLNLDIKNMWQNNPALTNVAGCFANVYNVYCTGLTFHLNITSSKTINISGLFMLNDSTYRNTTQIEINLNEIVPTLTTNNYFYRPTSNGSYGGTFQFRKVKLTTSSGTNILAKLRGSCNALFYGALLYIGSEIENFNISNVTECSNMFRSCLIYKLNDDASHTYTNSDRHFVTVTMPTSCAIYSSMFRDSSVLTELPSFRASNASTMDYMYSNAIINLEDIPIPYNFFTICKNNLSNVSHMFDNCKYITYFTYNEAGGLFSDCRNLANVVSMFEGANYLHGGIPVNFFGSTNLPYVLSLKNMFASTLILYDIADDSHKWINQETVLPLINLDNIDGMFKNGRLSTNNYSSKYSVSPVKTQVKDGANDVYIISPDTFMYKNISYIREFFMNTDYFNIPFQFSGFLYASDAFYDSAITEINTNFVNENNISLIKDVTRMFYDYTTGTPSKSITNLEAFITAIVPYTSIQKALIAGNLTNDLSNINGVDYSNLKQSSVDANGKHFNGFSVNSNRVYS